MEEDRGLQAPKPLLLKGGRLPLSGGDGRRPEGVGEATKWRGDSVKSKHVPELTPRAKELRKNMTPEERRLWYDFLRGYPVRFLRQKVIDGYIVDFYCASAKIVIELDGAQHDTQEGAEYDEERDKLISAWGIEVVRVPNVLIRESFEETCRYIDQIVKARVENRK